MCTKPDGNLPLLPYLQRYNDMVISWLLNSFNKNIRDSVLFCDITSAMWKEMEERYGQSNKARIFQAQKDVRCISQVTWILSLTLIKQRGLGRVYNSNHYKKRPNKDEISDGIRLMSDGVFVLATELVTEDGCRIFARR